MTSAWYASLQGMRELIVTEFVSLDGIVEAPGGEPGFAHSGWVGPHFSDALGEYKLTEQLAADVLLLGRITYESFRGAWPGREGPMAEKINTMRKVVVSTTLADSDWNGTTVTADAIVAVTALKAEEGGPILVAGSRTLVHTLLGAGLVDQLNLQVMPVVLGSGARIYPETESTISLRLDASTALENGVLLQSYRLP